MPENFDEQIEQRKTQKNNLKEEMETIRLEFIQATVRFLSNWYLPVAKRIFQANSDVSIKLTGDEVETIKIRAKELSDNAQANIEEFLSEPKLWWHLDENSDAYYHPLSSTRRNTSPLDKRIRYVMGLLAELMEEFGFFKYSHDKRHYIWREWDSSGNFREIHGKPYYPDEFEWTDEMKGIIEQYQEKLKIGRELVKEIKEIETEKRNAEVLDKWETN